MTQTGVKEAKVQETVLSGEATETITAYFNNLVGSPVYGHFLPGRTTGQSLPCCSVLFLAAPLMKALTQRSPRVPAQLFKPGCSLCWLCYKRGEFYFYIPSKHLEFYIQEGFVSMRAVVL